MKLYYSIITALVVGTAHAETWVYHDTLPTEVKVYIDADSIRTVWAEPLVRQARLSLGRPGEETVPLTVEAHCLYRGIRTNPAERFSVTQPDKTMGKLVTRLCNN
jgi:hypothetical protein